MSPAERVARGVELLDRVRPGWATEVDLADLQIRLPCDCVVGQVFGSYVDGLYQLFDEDADLDPDDRVERAEAHGFEAGMATYDSLQAEWTAVIAERQHRGGE